MSDVDTEIDEALALVAADRDVLLERLKTAADEATQARTRLPWRVTRQYNHLPEHAICAHRFEWAAEWCSRRRTGLHRAEIGVHFTVRRAER